MPSARVANQSLAGEMSLSSSSSLLLLLLLLLPRLHSLRHVAPLALTTARRQQSVVCGRLWATWARGTQHAQRQRCVAPSMVTVLDFLGPSEANTHS